MTDRVPAVLNRRVLTAVLALVTSTSATALAQPGPEPLPQPPPVTDPAPPPPPPPPPQPPPPPPPPPPPEPAPHHEATSADKVGPASNGFHVALGVGPSGGGSTTGSSPYQLAAGLSSQIKIGARISPQFRLYFHAVTHWYAKSDKLTQADGSVATTTVWRASSLTGAGADYFIHPRVALRGSLGLGTDLHTDLGTDPNAVGFSYLFGMSFELLDGDHRLAIDPYIHMLQHNQANLSPGTANQWVSRPNIGVTVNWTFR